MVGKGFGNNDKIFEELAEAGFEVHRITKANRLYFRRIFNEILKFYRFKLHKKEFNFFVHFFLKTMDRLTCEELFHKIVKTAYEKRKGSSLSDIELLKDSLKEFQNNL